MSKAYEKVAGVIGEEMDNAWKNIMDRLSQNGPSALSGATISSQELKEFFDNLGGARLGVDFASRAQKGQVERFSAYKISPSPSVAASGSISIGVNVSF